MEIGSLGGVPHKTQTVELGQRVIRKKSDSSSVAKDSGGPNTGELQKARPWTLLAKKN